MASLEIRMHETQGSAETTKKPCEQPISSTRPDDGEKSVSNLSYLDDNSTIKVYILIVFCSRTENKNRSLNYRTKEVQLS
jgi:hypothetical protein